MSSERPRAILIAGPTASGKSSAALKLAAACNGVIINADSMQVYAELRILSARPCAEDEALVPHYLYGTVPAATAYSTGMWVEQVADVLETVRGQGRLPIIVGGTGLYFYALENGLSPVPDIAVEVREKWRQKLVDEGVAALYDALKLNDETMAAQLKSNDSQRIVRALEVMEGTGVSLGEWHRREGSKPVVAGEGIVRVVIAPEREEIYRRCDRRLDWMIENGGLDEVRNILALKLDPRMPAMKALGVAQLGRFIDGEVSLDEALIRTKTDTRRYAKRQLTWIKRNMIAWNHINEQQSEKINAKLLSFI
jgi:tRNA dimethylallyltransferase